MRIQAGNQDFPFSLLHIPEGRKIVSTNVEIIRIDVPEKSKITGGTVEARTWIIKHMQTCLSCGDIFWCTQHSRLTVIHRILRHNCRVSD